MSSKSRGLRRGLVAVGLAGVAALAVAAPALAQPTDGHGERSNAEHSVHLAKGDLLVSRGLPRPSATRCTLVVSPPRDRPIP